MMQKKMSLAFIISLLVFFNVAHAEVTQSIQVINLLANNISNDPGITPTPVMVKLYNGGNFPCWYVTLNYQQDTTMHTGPNHGCVAKVSRIEITPLPVADKLKMYQGPVMIDLDTTKYGIQITILQDQPPVFNPKNGQVESPGTLQTVMQSNFR